MRLKDTSYQDTFESWFGISFNLTGVLGLVYILLSTSNVSSAPKRIVFPFGCMMVSFAIITGLVHLESLKGDRFFLVILGLTFISGICTSILGSALFAYSSRFPPQNTGAVIAGQALAGLIVSAANVLTVVLEPSEQQMVDSNTSERREEGDALLKSASIYFSIATVVLFTCIVSFLYLHKHTFSATSYQAVSASGTLHLLEEEENEALRKELALLQEPEESLLEHRQSSCEEIYQNSSQQAGIWELLCKMRWSALSLFMTFFVTLCIFPSVTSAIRPTCRLKSTHLSSVASRLCSDLFTPITFVLFNLGDYLGRVTGSWKQVLSLRGIFLGSLLRFSFLIVFLFCNYKRPPPTTELLDYSFGSSHGSNRLASLSRDSYAMLSILFLGFTGGYLANLVFIDASTRSKPQDHDRTGSILVLALNVGLFFGSMASLGLKSLLYSSA